MEHEYYLGSLNFKSNIRLLVLHPISPGNGNEGPFHLPEYDYLLKTTAVDEVYCAGAPRAIQGPADSEKAVPFIVEKARWADSQGYDAIIINCMLDPGVTATKNSVSIPVVGVREATRAIASLVGKSPAHIYPQNIPVLDLSRDEEKTVSELVNMGRKQISENGADVIIPNCGYLGGLAQRLQTELGVPVLANLDIALRLGELLAIFDVRPKSENAATQNASEPFNQETDAGTVQRRGIAYRMKSLIKRYFRKYG
jgi:allantoin racemase